MHVWGFITTTRPLAVSFPSKVASCNWIVTELLPSAQKCIILVNCIYNFNYYSVLCAKF